MSRRRASAISALAVALAALSLASCGDDGQDADDGGVESVCDTRSDSAGFGGDNTWDEDRAAVDDLVAFLAAVAASPSAPADVTEAASAMQTSLQEVTGADTHEQMQVAMSTVMTDADFLALGRVVDAWVQDECGDDGAPAGSPAAGGRDVTGEWMSLP